MSIFFEKNFSKECQQYSSSIETIETYISKIYKEKFSNLKISPHIKVKLVIKEDRDYTDTKNEKFKLILNIPEINDETIDVKLRTFIAVLQGKTLSSLIEKIPCQLLIAIDVHSQSAVRDNNKGEEETNILKTGENKENYTYLAQDPIYTFDKVILPDKVKDEILKIGKIIKNKNILYDEWGFREIEPKPKMILNFYGPPGTGKTMTAHALANYLNKKIIIANYAEIESKYVGEAPKNLIRIFEEAKKQDAILFFDEADAFLSKRLSNISSSSDHAFNALRNQMLMLLEDFEGVVIFASNFAEVYDRAFKSRIFKHIHFPLPDKEQRKKLIKLMIPFKTPLAFELDEEFLNQIAEISEGFSGRDLKNAIRETLITALYKNIIPVTKNLFFEVFNEYKQNHLNVNETKDTNKEKINEEEQEKLEKKIKESLQNKNYEVVKQKN
jgi:SpoVK/Ycf46/Vps4 family AAA+-type ATPase